MLLLQSTARTWPATAVHDTVARVLREGLVTSKPLNLKLDPKIIRGRAKIDATRPRTRRTKAAHIP